MKRTLKILGGGFFFRARAKKKTPPKFFGLASLAPDCGNKKPFSKTPNKNNQSINQEVKDDEPTSKKLKPNDPLLDAFK
jgi:hypothetical protein